MTETPLGMPGNSLLDSIRARLAAHEGPRYRLDHAPGLERTLVAWGEAGAFSGLEDELRPAWEVRRREIGALPVLPGRTERSRLHVLPCGEADLLVYAPTNLDAVNRTFGHFDFLDLAYRLASRRARLSALVEYGSHEELPDCLAVLRADGTPDPSAPAFAVTVAQWAGKADPRTNERAAVAGLEGFLAPAFGEASVLHALAATGAGAADALVRSVDAFSRRLALVRPVRRTPLDAVVVDLGAGRAFNLAGHEAPFPEPPAPRPGP